MNLIDPEMNAIANKEKRPFISIIERTSNNRIDVIMTDGRQLAFIIDSIHQPDTITVLSETNKWSKKEFIEWEDIEACGE